MLPADKLPPDVETFPLAAKDVAVAAPKTGVTRVGEVAKTSAPVPVSSVMAERRLALDGVAKNVAMPVPRPDIPVEIGKPVQFVSVPDAGIPSTGVVNEGEVVPATPPVPEGVPAKSVATPAPRPDTPVEIGSPVQFVSVPAEGTPMFGVVSTGLVAKTKAPEPVSSETAAARFALDGVAKNVAMPDPRPEIPVEIGKPVQFVSVPDAGVPSTGAVMTGAVRVLLVSVSVVARPTNVSVVAGNVSDTVAC